MPVYRGANEREALYIGADEREAAYVGTQEKFSAFDPIEENFGVGETLTVPDGARVLRYMMIGPGGHAGATISVVGPGGAGGRGQGIGDNLPTKECHLRNGSQCR